MPTAVCIVSRGLFHSRSLLGNLLAKYPAILTASSHRSFSSCALIRIAQALVSITSLNYLVVLFCSSIYSNKYSIIMPFSIVYLVNYFPKAVS